MQFNYQSRIGPIFKFLTQNFMLFPNRKSDFQKEDTATENYERHWSNLIRKKAFIPLLA